MNKIILFEPRSGSTYLASHLHHSYPKGTYKNLGEFLNGKRGVIGAKYIKGNRLEHLNILKSMKEYYILNIAPTDYICLGEEAHNFFKDKKIILLKRRNKRLQVLSFLYASITRVYHQYSGEEVDSPIVTAKKEHLNNLLDETTNIDVVAGKLNIEKEIFYEDFETDKDYIDKEFNIKLLDMSIRLPIKPDRHIEKYFDNMDEIDQWIKEVGYH